MMFRADTLRNITSSLTTLILIGGGMLFLYQLVLRELITGGEALAILGPLLGLAAQHVFSKDSQAQTRATIESATASGAASNGTTVTAQSATVTGEPVTVTQPVETRNA